MKLELANLEHINEIIKLVNEAYRGDIGWTKETNLVSGCRTTKQEIESLISNQNNHLLIYIENSQMVSCICIEQLQDQCYIGLFAVKPSIQNKGIGKKVLELAEEYAKLKFFIKKFIMVVISQREELIEYYQRRGYSKNGTIKEYPKNLDVGIPLTNNLTIEYLEKDI